MGEKMIFSATKLSKKFSKSYIFTLTVKFSNLSSWTEESAKVFSIFLNTKKLKADTF